MTWIGRSADRATTKTLDQDWIVRRVFSNSRRRKEFASGIGALTREELDRRGSDAANQIQMLGKGSSSPSSPTLPT